MNGPIIYYFISYSYRFLFSLFPWKDTLIKRQSAAKSTFMKNSAQIYPPLNKETEKIANLAEEESKILFETESVFPFSIFPDKVIIHPNKVDIVIGKFFQSNFTKSIFIKDMAGVEMVTTPFLAAIKISGNKMGIDPVTVRNLKRKNAIKIKEIIDGLLIALGQKIELEKLDPKQALPHLEKAGETHEEK
jgi:hypothetical protein